MTKTPLTAEDLQILRNLVELITDLYKDINAIFSADENKQTSMVCASKIKASSIIRQVESCAPIIVKSGGKFIATISQKIRELEECGCLTPYDANAILDQINK